MRLYISKIITKMALNIVALLKWYLHLLVFPFLLFFIIISGLSAIVMPIFGVAANAAENLQVFTPLNPLVAIFLVILFAVLTWISVRLLLKYFEFVFGGR